MKTKPLSPALFSVFLTLSALAAEPLPETEVYLLDLTMDEPRARNISQHQGYDNQPAFSADGKRVYYSRADEGQTDIWYYDLTENTNIRLTRTPESEYSPRPAPHPNSITVVRVESDRSQTLRLIDLDDLSTRNLAPELTTIGYYSWYSGGAVALFLLPEPFRLILYASKDEQLPVAENVGRTMARDPDSDHLLYVDKSGTNWQILAFDPGNGEKTVITPLFPGQEDFAVSSSGVLWTALGGKLYSREKGAEKWLLAHDLRADGIEKISRIAVSPDGELLALVAESADGTGKD